jgi:hypothetical protein
MYTGKDGRYHFPVEKLDGLSPRSTNAIKSGYFLKNYTLPESEVWQRQDAVTYAGRDIYLKKQAAIDPNWRKLASEEPNFHYGNGEQFCTWARTREAAAAGAEFIRIELGEHIKYGAGEGGIRATKSMLQQLLDLPTEAALEKK